MVPKCLVAEVSIGNVKLRYTVFNFITRDSVFLLAPGNRSPTTTNVAVFVGVLIAIGFSKY